jgi:hypothetical protein
LGERTGAYRVHQDALSPIRSQRDADKPEEGERDVTARREKEIRAKGKDPGSVILSAPIAGASANR